MHTYLIRLFFATTLAVIVGGCGKLAPSSFVGSGLPPILNDDALIRKISSSQGISVRTVKHGKHWGTRFAESECIYLITNSPGVSGQLLAAYRQEVVRTITSSGGSIHASNIEGDPQKDVSAFDYDYICGKWDGILRVRSFVGKDGRVQILSFCYEHQR